MHIGISETKHVKAWGEWTKKIQPTFDFWPPAARLLASLPTITPIQDDTRPPPLAPPTRALSPPPVLAPLRPPLQHLPSAPLLDSQVQQIQLPHRHLLPRKTRLPFRRAITASAARTRVPGGRGDRALEGYDACVSGREGEGRSSASGA